MKLRHLATVICGLCVNHRPVCCFPGRIFVGDAASAGHCNRTLAASVAMGCGQCSPDVSIHRPEWREQSIATKADFRGLCVVSAKDVWLSGTRGTYARTADAGKSWSVGNVREAETLDFRDVEAFGESTAYLLSAGPAEASRIYKTANGGKTWSLQFTNRDPRAFFDALALWDDQNGLALSDPVDGKFQLIVTMDGGRNWKRPPSNMPPALPNESAFAASGTCLVTQGDREVWFCTGGAKTARVFHSVNRGQDWTVSDTPILAGTDSSGIFSIAFRDPCHGMVVGGDYRKPNDPGANAAITRDAGRTWTLIERPLPFRSAVAWAADRWVVVGTSGSDFSQDDGATWTPLDKSNYNAAAFSASGDGWAAGPGGRVARFSK